MAITTEQIKELREATGVSVMQCKKALEEAGGDMEKAKIILRKISKQSAEKKADRNLGSGVVASYIHGEGGIGAMVELLCETDFVARNDEFKAIARDIAMHVAAQAPEYVKIEDVPEEAKTKAKELFAEEIENNSKDKTPEMKDKIITGKLEAYLKEKVLLEQSFIKNQDVLIKDLVSGAVQKFGEKTEIGRISRFSVK
ncbi:MAG TPA: elongation factor Ts [Candidatus Paceibacterota bacterium]